MNLTITFAESDVVLAVDVASDMTVGDLCVYAEEEAGYKSNASSRLYFNEKALNESSTLEEAGLHDDDMVQHKVSATVFTAPNGIQAEASPSNPQDMMGDSSVSLDSQIEAARQQILYDPQLFAQLSQQSPELADALHDPDQFQRAYRTIHQQQLKNRAENEEIDRNFRLALEEMPEAFTTVTMLFANIEVNGIPVKAFIDSGAQTTIMSPECAKRCNLSHLIDKRHRGMAYGVGQATILGRIHMAPIKIGSSFFACSMTVIEGTNMEFLLGLDMLKHHQATLDLKNNMLIMGEEELPFLGESEIPKNLLGSSGPAGTAIVAKPGTGLPRGALNNIGEVAGQSEPANKYSALSRAPAAQQQAGQSSRSSNLGPSSSSSPQAADPAVVNNLINLGFTRSEVTKALSQAGGNADIAAAILFGE